MADRFLECGFGFLQYFVNASRRTVRDRIAETIVVHARGSKARAWRPGEG